MKPGEIDFSKLGQARMPQVGERYVLRIRPGESVCENCGLVEGETAIRYGLQGTIVTVLGPAFHPACAQCGYAPEGGENGRVQISLTLPWNPFAIGVAPYTWLEPLEQQEG